MFDEEKNRRHIRGREDIPVRWRVMRTGQEGEGTIRNLSISGALLESRDLVSPGKDAEIQLEAKVLDEAFFVPREARRVWSKATYTQKEYYLCGLEFVAPTPYNMRAIEKRIEDRLNGMTGALGIGVLDRYFGL
ncbi:MAG: PilZ domain-containing protein [Candidatus Omnitrophica bacterium]|nr:PilZ domain-containing protein [Candidatus Omnitrophota bacterium]